MAVLFALDRADARDEIAHLTAANDVVILDRYVASNAAYSAARLHQGVDGDVVAWVRDLEYDRLELPKPDWQVLLAVPVALAAERAEKRARQEADRAKDAYERDDGLQQRTARRLQRARRGATGAAAGRPFLPTSTRRPSWPSWGIGSRFEERAGRAQIPVNTQNARVVAGVYRDLVTPWTP